MSAFNIALDLFPLTAGLLAAVSCGLLGNFLVLRRLSLMGDAISHSVLPGLVIAFLIASTRNWVVMFIGAAIAGIATVLLVELVKKLGRVEPGAAMGVVFSILFAIGVLLIEQAAARHVDLDADCVLHGQLETLAWFGAPDTVIGLFDRATLHAVPRQVWVLLVMTVVTMLFIALFLKELRIAAFDPALATTQGFNATALHYLLMIFVAGATVASFEAVGSILVIAMLICPAATARLLTDRLIPQILWSAVIALSTAVIGYFAATSVPGMFEKDSVNAAGSMTVVSGVLLGGAIFLSPRHGILMRQLRTARLRRRIAIEDLLAALYRSEENGERSVAITATTPSGRAKSATKRAGYVEVGDGRVTLTSSGRAAARELIRKHRLWETYLVQEAGLATDHVHETAELLEHMRIRPMEGPEMDPHGRRIPPAKEDGNRDSR